MGLGITAVAMESTGIDWVPLFEILEARRLEVVLVNARDAKNVPGRKTDVNDAQWLQQLHTYGLLRASFRPGADIVAAPGHFWPQRTRWWGAPHAEPFLPKANQIRDYGKTIEEAVKNDPYVLAPLKLHYLRWVLFDVGSGLHFMYQGIFDTDFDEYIEDAIALFNKTGITTVFTNLEGWPEDWRTNVQAVAQFLHEHQHPSFLEYGEYPGVTSDEIKKALMIKGAFAGLLDLMQ